MPASERVVSVVSVLAILGAIAGGWYGRWAEGAGFALSSVSWGFAVVLLPVGIGAGLALASWERRAAGTLAATAQAAMTLAFSVFAFALRASPAEVARIPWQVLVVLAGDVIVTTAGLAIAAGGAAYAIAALRRRARGA